MIIIYKEISYSINQICSGHNCLVIPVSPQFPDVQGSEGQTKNLWDVVFTMSHLEVTDSVTDQQLCY